MKLAGPNPVQKPLVLIVDDTPENIALMNGLLKERYRTRIATNGERALEAAAQEPQPDIVLLDVMMPGMDGYEVCRRLKADPATHGIPVVFLTAKSQIEDEQRGFDAGAVDYITKPISPPIVLARVHTHLTLKAEHERAEKLLLNVLPAAIAERLKREAVTIADAAEEVTVVFADLVGFTPLAAARSPADLVRLLDDIFTAFDGCAAQFGIEKIKTVGDAYVAVAGLPIARADHAGAAARFALALLDAIAKYNADHGMALKLRIGIESGPVVAGVIGTHKFSYDLWGDTVNAAARMESHSEPDRIQVAQNAARLLERDFVLDARGEIEVKGKGGMKTWWLTGPRSPRGDGNARVLATDSAPTA
jgi:class 3 adenylate cyclase